MDELIFFINKVIISGTVIGSIYALGAVGVTLVFGILRFAHFAHGDMMTLGAFFTYSLVAILATAGFSLPIPLGIALMPVAMALRAATDSTDRSMCPAMMTTARPMRLMASGNSEKNSAPKSRAQMIWLYCIGATRLAGASATPLSCSM